MLCRATIISFICYIFRDNGFPNVWHSWNDCFSSGDKNLMACCATWTAYESDGQTDRNTSAYNALAYGTLCDQKQNTVVQLTSRYWKLRLEWFKHLRQCTPVLCTSSANWTTGTRHKQTIETWLVYTQLTIYTTQHHHLTVMHSFIPYSDDQSPGTVNFPDISLTRCGTPPMLHYRRHAYIIVSAINTLQLSVS